jgi:uncharacterized protein
MRTATPDVSNPSKTYLSAGLVLLATIAFSALFGLLNYLNYTWLSPQFEQSSSQTGWGILQRLYLIIPCAAIALWRPRALGFQRGRIARHLPLLLGMLALNVAVVAGYRLLSGGTPYTGLEMLINEAVTVPLVEEVMWRGIVFAVLLGVLRRWLPEGRAGALAAVFSGVCFGLLHSSNALFGYPLAFVAIQVANASLWGVVYGIARAKTGSVYPSIVMHAAMNLAVALV